MKRALIAFGIVFYVAPGFGQTPAQPLQFEAASIKPNNSNRNGNDSSTTTGALTMRNYTLRMMIVEAYGLKEYQVTGGPKWADSDRYDITAKAAGPADDSQLYLMLQSMLAERFQLVVHRVSKPYAGYALLAGKKGLLVKAVEDTGKSSSRSHGGPTTFKEMSMEHLASWVARRMNAPVVDATGVPGVFDFTLDWTPESRLPTAPTAGVASDPVPTLFTALRQQLGVEVESRKVPTDTIVIDRAEKASEN
jgi:uncharacterized protein (TIGR03435 family)